MFDKTTLVKWLFLIICGHNQAIGPDDVEKVFDTLRDGGAFEADFAACCRPAAASCLLFTAWTDSFKSASVSLCGVWITFSHCMCVEILQYRKRWNVLV